jgi:SAM-dependent methyltransferase
VSSPDQHLIEWRLPDETLAVAKIDVAAEIERMVTTAAGPVLQIGSKADILDRAAKWRARFPNDRFVGLDIASGPNVDVTADIAGDLSALRRKLPVAQFGFIICAHVLEHVREPWVAARNIFHLLKPSGHLFVTVPWVQGYHDFPDDYWRMSFAGVRSLFGEVEFDTEFYSGAAETVGYRLLRNGKPEHSAATCRIERNLFQLMIETVPTQRMFDDQPGDKLELSRFYMPACSVNLFGRRVPARSPAR